jgi:hypothetical protein
MRFCPSSLLSRWTASSRSGSGDVPGPGEGQRRGVPGLSASLVPGSRPLPAPPRRSPARRTPGADHRAYTPLQCVNPGCAQSTFSEQVLGADHAVRPPHLAADRSARRCRARPGGAAGIPAGGEAGDAVLPRRADPAHPGPARPRCRGHRRARHRRLRRPPRPAIQHHPDRHGYAPGPWTCCPTASPARVRATKAGGTVSVTAPTDPRLAPTGMPPGRMACRIVKVPPETAELANSGGCERSPLAG